MLPTANMKQPRDRDLYLKLFLCLSEQSLKSGNNLRERERNNNVILNITFRAATNDYFYFD